MRNVTHHAITRINERGNNNINIKNKSLADNARKNGVSLNKYKISNGATPLVNYLCCKRRKHSSSEIFIYLNYVFIFRNKKLITLYPVPDKYIDELNEINLRTKILLGYNKHLALTKSQGIYKAKITSTNEEFSYFKSHKDLAKFCVEYFFDTDLRRDFFKRNENNKKITYNDFFNYLSDNNYLQVICSIKRDTYFDEIFIKPERKTYKLFIYEDDHFKLINEYLNKSSAVAKACKLFKETNLYGKFLKTKSKKYLNKNNADFYRFLCENGKLIIV